LEEEGSNTYVFLNRLCMNIFSRSFCDYFADGQCVRHSLALGPKQTGS